MKKIHRNLSVLQSVPEYLIYFFLYSVLGWVYEVVLEVFIYRWGYSDRGVLTGPYCIIYGFGALIFLILLKNLKSKRIGPKQFNLTPVLVFFAIIFIATVVELIGSYIMEFTQGSWMWDYSNYFAGKFSYAFLKKRLQKIKDHHTADSETNAWIQGDPSLKVGKIIGVIPHPASLCKFHDIASNQFYNRGNKNNGEKNKNRRQIKLLWANSF